MYRGNKEAFSFDDLALSLCLSGIEVELDRELSIIERAFFYMPMQHAEDLSIQDTGVQTFQKLLDTSPTDIRPHISRFFMSADRIAISWRNSAGFPIAIRPWDEDAR